MKKKKSPSLRKAKGGKPQKKRSETNSQKDSSKIRPLGDRVLVREIKETGEKTVSGIIIPISSEERSSDFKKGVVVATGPGKYDDGVLVPIGVSSGDTILFNWGDKIRIEDEEFYLVKESEISAIIRS